MNLYQTKLFQLKQQKVELENKISRLVSHIQQYESRIELLYKIKTIYVESSCIGRNNIKASIESLVTEGLKSIHEHSLKFNIEDSVRFGKSGCVFKVTKDENTVNLRCYGGGIRNIIATILRFMFAEYVIPKTNLPLVLDEIGYNLSEQYQDKFGNLLQLFSKKFDRQIILITHEQKISQHADKIFIVSNVNNESKVEESNVS